MIKVMVELQFRTASGHPIVGRVYRPAWKYCETAEEAAAECEAAQAAYAGDKDFLRVVVDTV